MIRLPDAPDLRGMSVGFVPDEPDHPVCIAIDEMRILLSLSDVIELTRAMAHVMEIAAGLAPRPIVGLSSGSTPDEIRAAARRNRRPPVQ